MTRGASTVVEAGIEFLQCCGRASLIVRGKVIFEPANPSPANLEGFRIFGITGTQNFRSKRSRAFEFLHVPEIGELERVGKGLSFLVERALSADIPVVIAVPNHRFADWIRFADGMSVKLRCHREALDVWWRAVSTRNAELIKQKHQTVCEVFK